MGQSVNLQISGINTSQNDFEGIPQGCMNEANNIEIRFKNTFEPRRGFESVYTGVLPVKRGINFPVSGTDKTIAVYADTTKRYLSYVANSTTLTKLNGVTNVAATDSYFNDPDSVYAKCRLNRIGQNLFLTTKGGLYSLASGSGSKVNFAGVPKALNLDATCTDYLPKTFTNSDVNTVAETITITSHGYVTGLAGYLPSTYGTPAPIVGNDTYYIIVVNANTVKLATSYANALAGTPVNLTTTGTAIMVFIPIGDGFLSNNGAATTDLSWTSGSSDARSANVYVGEDQTYFTGIAAGQYVQSPLGYVPFGTTVESVTQTTRTLIQAGNVNNASASITSVPSITGVTSSRTYVKVTSPTTGQIIIPYTIVTGTTGSAGNYTVTVGGAFAANQNYNSATVEFFTPEYITMSADANASGQDADVVFSLGSQCAYRAVFGRVDTDINGKTKTLLSSPSPIARVANETGTDQNVVVTGTIPKCFRDQDAITFVQVYRTKGTSSAEISPVDQYQLCYEASISPSSRTFTFTDDTPDNELGAALYAGSDKEGLLQSNDPPPMCWDVATFRDFSLMGNVTFPSTLKLALLGTGSPNGVQVNDVLTIVCTHPWGQVTGTYTAKSAENAASHEFQVYTSGTISQNLNDTAESLIRVINYDALVPVHAIFSSVETGLPGQMLLEADLPGPFTFTVQASAHGSTAWSPSISSAVTSDLNVINNGLAVSKIQEQEAVPSVNFYYVGDSSASILRVIALRDYCLVVKTDGVYKIQGSAPNALLVNEFDTTISPIGSDTIVALNSTVWMLSNQGVVAVSDGGSPAISIPVDDQINAILGQCDDNIWDVAFAVGYESDRKYLLGLPTANTDTLSTKQFGFNYITNAWTTLSRNLYGAFVSDSDGKLYIQCDDESNEGISKERKDYAYTDYVDEGTAHTIVSVSGADVVLSSVSLVAPGDLLWQSSSVFARILAVDDATLTVTTEIEDHFTAGACVVLKGYETRAQWKQIAGDNPAFLRQFSEGLILFKFAPFFEAEMTFSTDYSQSEAPITITGSGTSRWGMFRWGSGPWGGSRVPVNRRFYIPADKQLGSYVLVGFNHTCAYSYFKCQGLSISHYAESQEAGK